MYKDGRKNNVAQVFVDPSFKKKLKVAASMKGISIIKYTRELSKGKSLEEEFKKSKLDDGFKYEF